jgi:Flp pilus assembly protein TadB
MKFPQIFTKTPSNKKFSYTPRFYDPQEEERLEREGRIRRELEAEKQIQLQKDMQRNEELLAYNSRNRIPGSFRMAKKTSTVQSDPSASMLRLIILTILTVGLIAYLQFGQIALYALAFVFFPFYFYLKFRKPHKKS